ncbi:MAG TPA: methionyl-tRNA formyltransferase [Gammaproteobacteria bacterium]|nr:methionyl-tRNA formyltransferase [Gammaproteobacteria bacterium]
MRQLKLIFAGTPAFAVPALLALCEHPAVTVQAVYTQPDRPAGRGQALRESEVKRAARARGLPLEQPVSLRDPHAMARFVAWDCDLFVVAAYGQILPAAVIDAPRLGSINVHASLLPRWRGAAPIQRALMAGDAHTGITIMRIVERLDAGPMLLKATTPIAAHDTGGTLHDRLAALGGVALRQAIDAFVAGKVQEEMQDEALVTYARKIGPADRAIDWHESAASSERRVRALHPAPLAIATLGALRINVVAAEIVSAAREAAPGTLLAAGDDGLLVRCGEGALRLTRVQPPGKRAMSAREFLNGYRKQLPL